MARISSEKAVEAIGNRFDLVLIASIRQRELDRGNARKIVSKHGNHLTALQEIEEKQIDREYLKRLGDHKFLKQEKPKQKRPKHY